MTLLEQEEITLEWFGFGENPNKELFCTRDDARKILQKINTEAKKIFNKPQYKDLKDYIDYHLDDFNIKNLADFGSTSICSISRASFDSYFKLSKTKLNEIYSLFKSAIPEIQKKIKDPKITIFDYNNESKEVLSISIRIKKNDRKD